MTGLVPDEDGAVYLDHLGLFVPEFDAAQQLTRLGFSLTPFVAHQQRAIDGKTYPSGTGNRCAMFREGYLEMLGPVTDTVLSRQLRYALDRYPGLHLAAFAVTDARERFATLKDEFALQPVVRLERPVSWGGGRTVARFTVVRPELDTFPEGRIQLLSHHTPELVWQPEFMHHDNGAEALMGLRLCVDDPAEAAARFGRYLALVPSVNGSLWSLPLARGTVQFLDVATFNAERPGVSLPPLPYLAEVALGCRDLAATRQFFSKRGIPYQEQPNALYVPPDAALGMGLYLQGRGSTPWQAVTAIADADLHSVTG